VEVNTVMLIGREELLHQHERDLDRALARRAVVRLAKRARRDRRATAIGRPASSGSGRTAASRPGDLAGALERPR
jgi:hypothetical protein